MPKSVEEILQCTDQHEVGKWLRIAPLKDLEDYADRITSHGIAYTRVQSELARRRAKPHWSIIPALIVAGLAMIFAGIAAWPVILSWFHH